MTKVLGKARTKIISLMWLKRILSVLKICGLILLLSIVSLAVLPHTPFAKSYQSLVVLSGSMEPAVRIGSLILTASTDTNSLQKGDIITFQQDDDSDLSVTHRIDEVKDDGSFITKGDANDTADNIIVHPDEIQGKMLVTIPWLGYIVNFSKSLYGIILLVIIPAILIIIGEMKTIKNELEKEFKKKYNKTSEVKDKVNKIVSGTIFLLLCLSLSSGRTIACFADSEKSTGNLITVGIWGVDTIVTPDSATDFVVLNEFLPNPSGLSTDGLPRPDGEYAELYNNHPTESFNLTGWYLYDAIDDHDVAVTNTNSASFDDVGTLINNNTTIISPKGFLVVYLNSEFGSNGWLNNTGGDTIRLYTDEFDAVGSILVDSYAYIGDAGDNKTFARIPDGVGAWVDPIPTPGSANKLESPEVIIEPEVIIIEEEIVGEPDVVLPFDYAQDKLAQDDTYVDEEEEEEEDEILKHADAVQSLPSTRSGDDTYLDDEEEEPQLPDDDIVPLPVIPAEAGIQNDEEEQVDEILKHADAVQSLPSTRSGDDT